MKKIWSSAKVFTAFCLSLALVYSPIPFLFMLPASANVEQQLTKQIAAIAASFKGKGRLGVGVVDIDSGEAYFFNGSDNFRMQSVAKMLVAIAILRQVDAGKLKLSQDVAVTPKEIDQIGMAALPENLPRGTKSLKLSYLIERSMLKSNNGTSDVLTRLLGGPAAVDKVFKALGFMAIRVDRYERQVSEFDDANSGAALLDSATPEDICSLLQMLHQGLLLKPASANYLLELMRRCQTGDNRLRAGLSAGWTIAEKTGTGRISKGISVSTNDVGIITSPKKHSYAVAVFVADAKLSRAQCEEKIAQVAKAICTLP
ncbi:MAG: class A beta-lactamase [Candidatus Obscuribacterales bacterium]|nr:class A beta-lactamase [Candidatus Obscuribacterales bacterium]